MTKVHVLLMAAGGSTRMGLSKPLLKWGEGNLLEHQLELFKDLGIPITVVLGSKADEVMEASDMLGCQALINENWRSGLGNSIAYGVSEVLRSTDDVPGILIALTDQPLIGAAHFKRMIDRFHTQHDQIVVSVSEQGYWSVPVLFPPALYPDLTDLNGDSGAMNVVRTHAEKVCLVHADGSLDDMDTPDAYEKMLKRWF